MNNQYTDIFLNVAHIWQEDPEHDIPPKEGRKICAIAAMKIIIDYLPPHEDKSIKLGEIRNWMVSHDGLEPTKSNWYHHKQVEYLSKLGYIAWRRNWRAPSQDPSWFEKNENYSLSQMDAVTTQIESEKNIEPLKQKVLQSFINQFNKDCPVIVSVKLGFDSHGENHQLVLNGYLKNNSGEHLYIVDPILHPHEVQPKQKVELETFFKYFNYFAIFAESST